MNLHTRMMLLTVGVCISCMLASLALVAVHVHIVLSKPDQNVHEQWTRTEMQLWAADLKGRNSNLSVPHILIPLQNTEIVEPSRNTDKSE